MKSKVSSFIAWVPTPSQSVRNSLSQLEDRMKEDRDWDFTEWQHTQAALFAFFASLGE